mmetsp:Transcript_53305/g.111235  ORF Transcript_53305/g.111235 Transcript_53305/m.111235 type:complete len:94 (+) Transcript_53305:4170-4451(+)
MPSSGNTLVTSSGADTFHFIPHNSTGPAVPMDPREDRVTQLRSLQNGFTPLTLTSRVHKNELMHVFVGVHTIVGWRVSCVHACGIFHSPRRAG